MFATESYLDRESMPHALRGIGLQWLCVAVGVVWFVLAAGCAVVTIADRDQLYIRQVSIGAGDK
jgi:hypothetical protein